MSRSERSLPVLPMAGHCDARFAAVRDAFASNFAERGDLGAALCITLDGRPVVDLWGGWRDAQQAGEVAITLGEIALCGRRGHQLRDVDAVAGLLQRLDHLVPCRAQLALRIIARFAHHHSPCMSLLPGAEYRSPRAPMATRYRVRGPRRTRRRRQRCLRREAVPVVLPAPRYDRTRCDESLVQARAHGCQSTA